jgi:hypothetical protein
MPTAEAGKEFVERFIFPTLDRAEQLVADKTISLNLSLFVEDQNSLGIGQTLPFSLYSRPLGLMPLVRSVPPARTHSDAESSARIERSPRSLGGWFC